MYIYMHSHTDTNVYAFLTKNQQAAIAKRHYEWELVIIRV